MNSKRKNRALRRIILFLCFTLVVIIVALLCIDAAKTAYISAAENTFAFPGATDNTVSSSAVDTAAKGKSGSSLKPSDDNAKSSSVKLSVPYISQQGEFPTGCESVSAVMALNFAGVDIAVGDFIDSYLPQSGFYDKNGVTYGPDPNYYFVGDPRSSYGYGCYSGVIKTAVQDCLNGEGSVVDESGESLDALCRKYIDNGIPVIVWASINMSPTKSGSSWTLPDGSDFTWTSGEHCLVLTGYDEDNYYFNDPLQGQNTGYDKQTVQARYNELGNQALVILSE